VHRAYQIPRSHADLRQRRLFSEKWAEATFGLMGRTPDHVAGFFTGYASVPEVFAKGGQKFADNVVAFYERMRDEHLYVSYAIVPPQIDRSKPAHKQSDPALYAGVVKERDDGIVISGAQQLATGGVLSDWLHLSCIHPLQPGDENYANCLAVPINTTTRRILATLMRDGRVRRAYLGLVSTPAPLPASLAERIGQRQSLRIVDVVKGAPADRAGLKPGDLVLSAGRAPVAAAESLQRLLFADAIGTPLPLTVLRNGAMVDVIAVPIELDRV